MNPTAEQTQTPQRSEFNVAVNAPQAPQGMININNPIDKPKKKAGGGFFSQFGKALGIEAAPILETPVAEKPKDFSIPETVSPIDGSKPLGVPAGVSNGIESSSVPQTFQQGMQGVEMDPSKPASQIDAAPVIKVESEDQKFNLDPNAIKSVNAPGSVLENAPVTVSVETPIPKAIDEGLKDVNLDPTVSVPQEQLSQPRIPEIPTVPVQAAGGQSSENSSESSLATPVIEQTSSSELVSSGIVAPETHEEEMGPTAPTIEHPANPVPSSLDSASVVSTSLSQSSVPEKNSTFEVSYQTEKKDVPDSSKDAVDSNSGVDEGAKEEPLLFAEQGAVEAGVLPGADATIGFPTVEKLTPEKEEKLEITGKAIDAMEAQAAKKDESSKWIIESTEKEAVEEDPIASIVFHDDPTKYLKFGKNGQPDELDEEALDTAITAFKKDPKNTLILIHSNPSIKSKLEQRGIKLKPVQELQKAA